MTEISPPCILAIDASTGPCSAAVWSGNRISAYIENTKPVMQSASLIPMVEDAIAQSGITYNDLTHIVATTGPGSFTGIRVGLASAQGIAMAAGKTASGFTTLDVLAYAALQQSTHPILAILNAGKGECYYQYFSAGPQLHALSEPTVDSLESALVLAPQGPVTVAGNITVGAAGFTHCGVMFPRADTMAEMAARSFGTSHVLRPFYIRAPDAKLPKDTLTSNLL